MFKRESGITLVALVITIIILIILAAVSITTVMKNDLFGLAKTAADNYLKAGQAESTLLSELVSNVTLLESELDSWQKTLNPGS